MSNRIVLTDFSSAKSPESSLAAIAEARAFWGALPRERRYLSLIDVTEAAFDGDVIAHLKALGVENTSRIEATAVVGAEGLRRFIMRTVALLSRRKVLPFDDRERALEWLRGLEP